LPGNAQEELTLWVISVDSLTEGVGDLSSVRFRCERRGVSSATGNPFGNCIERAANHRSVGFINTEAPTSRMNHKETECTLAKSVISLCNARFNGKNGRIANHHWRLRSNSFFLEAA
jgi:hypothetical protein